MVLKRHIEELTGKRFDLIIVGGGITGAAVAYIAAARGLSVALFEKEDYGGATSFGSCFWQSLSIRLWDKGYETVYDQAAP